MHPRSDPNEKSGCVTALWWFWPIAAVAGSRGPQVQLGLRGQLPGAVLTVGHCRAIGLLFTLAAFDSSALQEPYSSTYRPE